MSLHFAGITSMSDSYSAQTVTGQPLGCSDVEKHGKEYARDYAFQSLCIQIAVIGLLYTASPGYMTPFLHHPIGGTVFASLFLAQIISFTLVLRFIPKTKSRLTNICIAISLLLSFPQVLAAFIGPAITPYGCQLVSFPEDQPKRGRL